MKKQLQEFLLINKGRILLLAMMIFIGPGLAFSQRITVTNPADNGAGTLRQAIADAVDGDVIDFNGAISTIVLDTTLELGDKTITIEGGGDVVLHRDVLALDSFRLVTITGVMDKLVTLEDLTIENGIAWDDKGGGLLADHSDGGVTTLDGVIFKNNKSNEGGGAHITGYNMDTVSVVNNCEFIANESIDGFSGDGDGGGIYVHLTKVTGCTFLENVAQDDGGALWVRDAWIFDSHIEGNSGGDAGGAVRIQGDGSFTNCKFVSNSSADQGGAIFSAHGSMIDCEFIDNIAVGKGGGVSANNDDSYITNCTFTGNTAGTIGGGLYVDDDGQATNCVFTNNQADLVGGGIYVKGKNGPGLIAGAVVAYNTADSIGGGIHVLEGDVINSVITKNYAGKDGGAFSGDGAWLIANSIVFDNDAAGDAKNIYWIANSNDPSVVNTASDVDYSAETWASGAITLATSPFIGGTEADSLMLPYSSPLIDAGSTDAAIADLLPATDLNGSKRIVNGVVDLGAYERLQSFVVTTDADEGAGSLRQIIADAVDGESIITFADGITTILVDTTLEMGDKTLIIDGGGDVVLDGAFNTDVALDTNRVITITGVAEKMVTIKNLTIQNGYAEDGNGGGISADHGAGGKTILENIVFDNNTALREGGGLILLGYADNPSNVTNCTFTNNYVDNGSGEGDGGGMYGEYTMVTGCDFTNNEAKDDAGAIYAQVGIVVSNTTFTANTAGGAGGAIRTGDENNVISSCIFDSNITGGQGGGAILLARGSVFDSDFIDNTSGDKGGAILANNNECTIDNSMFTGNSSATVGGAIYFDDGGVLSNSIVKGNIAGTDGGGIYLAGKKAPPSVVGTVVTNNTTTATGGGLHILSGNVINSIVTNNNAGTNGGAITGDGEWFVANSVVFGNDAVGADKNIEIVSNSAATAAANSAIDATAYNDTWTAVNITMLDASPFVGGTGADSLYFPENSPLVDAGTLEYGIADLLPEMDLDGNARIQGDVDMGVYETEIIGVLGVTLEPTLIEMSIGATETLVVTIDPVNAGDKSVTWTSSDETVATVVDGVVTAVSSGSATITVTTNNGGYTATSEVTVVVNVTGITLDQSAVTLDIGGTVSLVATIEPANATDQTVLWASGNEDVATVDANGLVTAVAAGNATITAITKDGGEIALCEVTVNEPVVSVTGVSLDQSALELEPGGTATLVATVAPEDATDKSVSWSSSDDAVATVADGVVTAVADGTCTITVTTTDGGETATCDVTVETVGIENFEAGFRMYPNPVQENLFIEGENIRSVSIYSITGEAVMVVEDGISKGINMSTIESGIYILKIKSDSGTAAAKIVKE